MAPTKYIELQERTDKQLLHTISGAQIIHADSDDARGAYVPPGGADGSGGRGDGGDARGAYVPPGGGGRGSGGRGDGDARGAYVPPGGADGSGRRGDSGGSGDADDDAPPATPLPLKGLAVAGMIQFANTFSLLMIYPFVPFMARQRLRRALFQIEQRAALHSDGPDPHSC